MTHLLDYGGERVSQVVPYRYHPLNDGEIRVIKLHPGEHTDSIQINIEKFDLQAHVELKVSNKILPPAREQILQLCPPDVELFQTPEGQYYFEDVATQQPQYLIRSNDGIDGSAPQGTSGSSPNGFEAISYCWGKLPATETLYIDPDSLRMSPIDERVMESQYIKVSPTLESMLRDLRKSDAVRTLWIDAICIDMQNKDEQMRQIAVMSEIYHYATNVILFLQPLSDWDVKSALETLGRLANVYEISTAFNQAQRSEHQPTLSEDEWMAVDGFFSCEAFGRLWCLQEMVLADPRTMIIQVGANATISAYHLRRAMAWLLAHMEDIHYTNIYVVQHLVGFIFRSGPGNSSVYQLFRENTPAKCTKPVDRINAVLSMMSSKVRGSLAPSTSDNVCEVYRDAFLSMSRTTGRLHFLSFCDLITYEPNLSFAGWPTWVPKFGGYSTSSGMSHPFASGMSCAEFSFNKERNLLKVQGQRFDEVEAVLETFRYEDDFIEKRQKLKRAFEAINRQGQGCYPSGISWLYAYVRLWDSDHFVDRSDHDFGAREFEQEVQCMRCILGFSDNALPEDWTLRAFEYTNESIKLFQTKKGYLGIASDAIEPGDYVSVILGCQYPITLRAEPQNGNCYRLLGRSYVQGLMNGEALLGPLPEKYKHFVSDVDGMFLPRFKNQETNMLEIEDPRLAARSPLPYAGWNRVQKDHDIDDLPYADHFRQLDIRDEMNADPRMRSSDLKAIGVEVEELVLI